MRSMFEWKGRYAALATGLTVAMVVTACGGEAEFTEDMSSVDDQSGSSMVEAPSPDQESPMPSASAGEATTPAPAAGEATTPVPAIEVRALPAGTLLTFEVGEDVSTDSHESGDTFTLVLADEVTGVGGAVLPVGTSARGLVVEAHPSSGSDEEALLVVRVGSVEVNGTSRTLEGEVEGAAIRGAARDSGTRTAAKIATGAAAGAMIGQILGRDTRSTVQGAAVGTAAGVGVALSTRDGHAELPSGSRITVRLDGDLEI